MPSIKGKKWYWCLFTRLLQASLANVTVLYNILHPESKKGSKDVVIEICEYFMDEFNPF